MRTGVVLSLDALLALEAIPTVYIFHSHLLLTSWIILYYFACITLPFTGLAIIAAPKTYHAAVAWNLAGITGHAATRTYLTGDAAIAIHARHAGATSLAADARLAIYAVCAA